MRRPVGVKSILFSLRETSFSPAEWPLSPCFHPHSRGANRSLGACWAFSVQPVLPSVWRPVVLLLQRNLGQAINAVTGTRLWAFVFSLPGTILTLFLPLFYAAAATVVRLLWLCRGSYASPLTHR